MFALSFNELDLASHFEVNNTKKLLGVSEPSNNLSRVVVEEVVAGLNLFEWSKCDA